MKELTPFVSAEQQEANTQKLEAWRDQLPSLMADYRKWAAQIGGSRRAINAMLDTVDLVIGQLGSLWRIDGDAAVMNMPSTLKLQAAGVPGQRMSIVGRIREAARLGIIELWTEEEAGFKGEKIVIPLERGLSPFYSKQAQGEEWRGVTAHSRRGNGEELLRNLPVRRTTRQVGYATRSELGELRKKVHVGAYMLIVQSPTPITRAELARQMGIHRSGAGRIIKGLKFVGLIREKEGSLSPTCPPCAVFLRRQKNVDLDAQVRSRIKASLKASLIFHQKQAMRLRRLFSPTQAQVVKNARAIRALEGMLAACDAGEAGSRFVNRRYV